MRIYTARMYRFAGIVIIMGKACNKFPASLVIKRGGEITSRDNAFPELLSIYRKCIIIITIIIVVIVIICLLIKS